MRRLAAVLLASCCLAGPADARLFTDAQGRTIDAEIVAISATHVRLNKGGRLFDVAIETLSEADQAFLRSEREENARKQAAADRLSDLLAAPQHGARPKAGGRRHSGDDADEAARGGAAKGGANDDFVGGTEPAGGTNAVPAAAGGAAKAPAGAAGAGGIGEGTKPGAAGAKAGAAGDPQTPGTPGKLTVEAIDPSKKGGPTCFLYLPTTFTREREWPVLLLLAASGHAQRDVVRRFEKPAERNGMVLVSPAYEVGAKVPTPVEEVDEAVLAALPARLPMARDRLYLAGLGTAVERGLKLLAASRRTRLAGVLACDAGLSRGTVELPRGCVFFATCGAGSSRRYDVAYTFSDVLKGDEHVLRFFLGSNTWPPEGLLDEGLRWMNICYLRSVPPGNKAALAERAALAAALLEQFKAAQEADPVAAYDLALTLQSLDGEPAVARELPPLLRTLGQNPAVKQYIEAKKDLDSFVRRHFAVDPRELQAKGKEDAALRRSAERIAEKYKDTPLQAVMARFGEPVL